jgi:hypothetical protein
MGHHALEDGGGGPRALGRRAEARVDICHGVSPGFSHSAGQWRRAPVQIAGGCKSA